MKVHNSRNAQYTNTTVSIISSFGIQLHEFKRRELSLGIVLITLLHLCACKCCEFSCMVSRHLLEVQNMLPATVIHFTESVPIAHILFQNLEDFLPSSVDGLK